MLYTYFLPHGYIQSASLKYLTCKNEKLYFDSLDSVQSFLINVFQNSHKTRSSWNGLFFVTADLHANMYRLGKSTFTEFNSKSHLGTFSSTSE